MSVLFFHSMRYRPEDPRNFNNDRFILSKVWDSQSYWPGQETLFSCLCVSKYHAESDLFFELPCFFLVIYDFILCFMLICDWDPFFPQGHAAPALYSMWVETGLLKESELLSLCQVDSALEGHPSPVSCHILYHTSIIISWSASSVCTITLFSVFVVSNSEAANYWCCHWILGAGSWCGLWNGLHWEILWQG